MSEYGSTFREAMKRSMSQPAGFKPLNRVARSFWKNEGIILFLYMIAAILAGSLAVFSVDKVESRFRPAAEATR